MQNAELPLDGNVLGGVLGEVLAADLTTARCRCGSCGAGTVLGAVMVYADAPGMVARCPACAAVMLRVVRAPDRAWVDLSGVASLQLAMPGA